MKYVTKLKITLLTVAFLFNQAMASELVNDTKGLTRVGVVSVSNVNTLSELESALKEAAELKNAKFYKISSAGGDNFLYGSAVIYN